MPSAFRFLIIVALLSAIKLAAPTIGHAQRLDFTFLGNCGVRIKLDSGYLFTDFPYRPGAYGYIDYDFNTVYRQEEGIALFTHLHGDHQSGKRLAKTKLLPVTPRKLKRGLSPATTERLRRYGLTITPIKTTHMLSLAHDSYFVEWQGRRVYFTGDTESPANLLTQTNLDVVFINPWLFNTLVDTKQSISAKHVIIYHHRADTPPLTKTLSTLCACQLLIPKQGESYSLDVSKP